METFETFQDKWDKMSHSELQRYRIKGGSDDTIAIINLFDLLSEHISSLDSHIIELQQIIDNLRYTNSIMQDRLGMYV